MLIVFEGLDGAGKSTQIRALAQALRARGEEVVCSKEPTDGPFGAALRRSAKTGRLPIDEEIGLFLKDRRQHVEELIQPALDRGAYVLLDRYYFSTCAYQGARGVDPEELRSRNEAFAPRPDLLVILEIEPEDGLARVRRRGDEADAFEQLESLRRVKAIFDRFTGDWILRLDAREAPEALTAAILARAQVSGKPKGS
jgi:dTMP kinase